MAGKFVDPALTAFDAPTGYALADSTAFSKKKKMLFDTKMLSDFQKHSDFIINYF